MVDVVGKKVDVGDIVSYIVPRKRYLDTSTVRRVTSKGVTLQNGVSRLSHQFVKI